MSRLSFIGCTDQNGLRLSFRIDRLLFFAEVKDDPAGANCSLGLSDGDRIETLFIKETFEQVNSCIERFA